MYDRKEKAFRQLVDVQFVTAISSWQYDACYIFILFWSVNTLNLEWRE